MFPTPRQDLILAGMPKGLAVGGMALFLSAAAPVPTPVMVPVPTITPTQVFLSPELRNGAIRLTNERDTAIRFELKAFAWAMRPDGEMELQPTDDVRLSAADLTLEPRGTVEVRVDAATAPVTGREETYRISITEKPAAEPPSDAGGEGGGPRVLASITLPVFLRPDGVRPDGRIEGKSLGDGTLSVAISNMGSAHLFVRDIVVKGQDAKGGVVFEISRNGWYVLASDRREYRAILSARDCRRSSRLIVRATLLDGTTLEHAAETRGDRCGRAEKTEFARPSGRL